MRKNLEGGEGWGYHTLNELASRVPPGSEGLVFLPYGNGAERTLENRESGPSLLGLDLNRNRQEHVLRAAQEGVAFALRLGLEIMEEMGFRLERVRAGRTNLFLSSVFQEAFAAVSGVELELYETNGAQGAARGAVLGASIYPDWDEAFRGLVKVEEIRCTQGLRDAYLEAYARWRKALETVLGGYRESRAFRGK